jgi:hypothetical protein
MKKIVLIIIIVLAAWFFVRFVLGGPEDDWICVNNEWVRHGSPSSPKPTTGCVKEPNIVVDQPLAGDIIKGPFAISGKAKTWYFEGSFPVELVDNQNNKIAVGYAKAMGDWMTADYVAFETGEINFLSYPKATTTGFVVFKKDNPSDLRELDEEFRVAVTIAPIETIKVKVYFNNNKLDPEISCNKVFPVEREIIKTTAVARAALEELLKGPSNKDGADGFTTSINYGVKIQKLTIEGGVAKVDFDEQLQQGVGGSCRVSAIRSQITQTLKQFPSVKNVIISVNGETETILQP